MRSEAIRDVLLWIAAVMCAIAAVVAGWRGDARSGAVMGAVALVFAVIAVSMRRGRAGNH